MLPAGAIYRIEIFLVTRADAATDFSYQAVRAAGLTSATLRLVLDLDSQVATPIGFNTTQNIAGAGVTAARAGLIVGVLDVGAVGGRLALAWRQQTSGTAVTALMRGSYIKLTPLG